MCRCNEAVLVSDKACVRGSYLIKLVCVCDEALCAADAAVCVFCSYLMKLSEAVLCCVCGMTPLCACI